MTSRRRGVIVAAAVLVAAAAVAARVVLAPGGRAGPRSAADAADAAYVRQHYTKHEFRVPMRDGVRLFTAVYVPRDASARHRYPFVLARTPFSVAPCGQSAYPRMLGPDRYILRDGCRTG